MSTFYSIHDHYISHHGIQGQKWGIRRYQNPDGTLTEEGRKRYEKLLKKYTYTTKKGNVLINKPKMKAARGAGVVGGLLSGYSAIGAGVSGKLLYNNAKDFKKASEDLNSIQQRLGKSWEKLHPKTAMLSESSRSQKPFSDYLYRRKQALEQAQHNLLKAKYDYAEFLKEDAAASKRSSKRALAVFGGISAGLLGTIAVSSIKHKRDLEYLNKYAQAYGGKSLKSLEKDIEKLNKKKKDR